MIHADRLEELRQYTDLQVKDHRVTNGYCIVDAEELLELIDNYQPITYHIVP